MGPQVAWGVGVAVAVRVAGGVTLWGVYDMIVTLCAVCLEDKESWWCWWLCQWLASPEGHIIYGDASIRIMHGSYFRMEAGRAAGHVWHSISGQSSLCQSAEEFHGVVTRTGYSNHLSTAQLSLSVVYQ